MVEFLCLGTCAGGGASVLSGRAALHRGPWYFGHITSTLLSMVYRNFAGIIHTRTSIYSGLPCAMCFIRYPRAGATVFLFCRWRKILKDELIARNRWSTECDMRCDARAPCLTSVSRCAAQTSPCVHCSILYRHLFVIDMSAGAGWDTTPGEGSVLLLNQLRVEN